MRNRVVALITCALGFSVIGHFGCTAVEREYSAGPTGGSSGASGSSGSAGSSGASGDAGVGAGGASSGAGGDAGSSAGSAGSSGSSAGSGGEAGAPSNDCTADNTPCQVVGLSGLCFNGTCTTCIDMVDDPNCVTAYGAGTLCIGGTCIPADCRSTPDCMNKVCKDNHCVGCASDGDCGDPTLICNTTSGACVSNACTSAQAGQKCAANGKDVCCTLAGSSTCAAGECCVDADCKDVTKACVGKACVPAACKAPTDHVYYVDASAAAEGTGSTTCPFKTITHAFKVIGPPADAKTDAIVINVKGPVGAAETFPIYWPQGLGKVTLQGADAPTVITVPANGTGFQIASTANTENNVISGFMIQQPTAATATAGTAFGVQSTSTPTKPQLSIDHVLVRYFHTGIYVHAGGFLGVGEGVSVVQNVANGLFLDSGSATISVPLATSLATHFDGNNHGIYVDGATSALTIKGICISGCPTTGNPNAPVMTVTANNNAGVGFRVYSQTASSIDGLNADSNGAQGGYIYATSLIKVRSTTFRKNGTGGIRIRQGSADPATVSGIDLGKLASYGHNLISGNSGSGICVDTRSAVTIYAQGNAFKGGDNLDHDCSVATPSYKPSLTTSVDCSSANLGFLDVAGTILVDNCTNQ